MTRTKFFIKRSDSGSIDIEIYTRWPVLLRHIILTHVKIISRSFTAERIKEEYFGALISESIFFWTISVPKFQLLCTVYCVLCYCVTKNNLCEKPPPTPLTLAQCDKTHLMWEQNPCTHRSGTHRGIYLEREMVSKWFGKKICLFLSNFSYVFENLGMIPAASYHFPLSYGGKIYFQDDGEKTRSKAPFLSSRKVIL